MMNYLRMIALGIFFLSGAVNASNSGPTRSSTPACTSVHALAFQRKMEKAVRSLDLERVKLIFSNNDKLGSKKVAYKVKKYAGDDPLINEVDAIATRAHRALDATTQKKAEEIVDYLFVMKCGQPQCEWLQGLGSQRRNKK